MGWEQSKRRQQLPPNWQQLRKQIADRAGGQCEATMHDGTRCTQPGTDCDHIQRGNNHSLNNLQWLCHWHHEQKTRAEANDAIKQIWLRNKIPERPHPGLK